MNDKLFFSIIIPTYNSGKIIESCLQSIVSQSFSDFEVIVTDGLSTDNTLEIIKKFSKTDNRFIIHSEKDNGIYDAMNKGIDLAKGKWLYFLGSDDQLYDDSVLKSVVDTVGTGSHNILYGNVLVNGNTSWAKDKDIYDGKFDLRKLLRTNICHQSIFYNTEFIKKEVGYYNLNYKVCADWDYNFRCWAKSGFTFLDKVIALFNGGGESTKNDGDPVFANDFLANVKTYFKISPFDSLLDDPGLWYYPDVLAMQKEQNYLGYFANKLRKKIGRWTHAKAPVL